MFIQKEGPRLTIELVPETCHCSNLRSNLKKADWDKIRKAAYQEAGYRCTVCFGKGRKHPVEAHELWSYDMETLVQKLVDVVALCPDCHKVKHLGLSELQGYGDYARKHLAKINRWDAGTAARYEAKCFEEWKQRSMFHWSLDVTWLENRGVTIPRVFDRLDFNSSPLPHKARDGKAQS